MKYDPEATGRAFEAGTTKDAARLAEAQHLAPARKGSVPEEAMTAALLRRLLQLMDSAGESQRSLRSRYAEAAFHRLHRDEPAFLAEYEACDRDPIGYLQRRQNEIGPSVQTLLDEMRGQERQSGGAAGSVK